VADAVPEALGDDWREEGCDEIVRDIRAVLGDGRQQEKNKTRSMR
jgi:hypothetical protein